MKLFKKVFLPFLLIAMLVATTLPAFAAAPANSVLWRYDFSNSTQSSAYYTYNGEIELGTRMPTGDVDPRLCFSFTAPRKGVYMIPKGVIISDRYDGSAIYGCRMTLEVIDSSNIHYLLFGMQSGETIFVHKASGGYNTGFLRYFGQITAFTPGDRNQVLTKDNFKTSLLSVGYELTHHIPTGYYSDYVDAPYYVEFDNGVRLRLDKTYISDKEVAGSTVYFTIHAMGYSYDVQARYQSGSSSQPDPEPERPTGNTGGLKGFFERIRYFFETVFDLITDWIRFLTGIPIGLK